MLEKLVTKEICIHPIVSKFANSDLKGIMKEYHLDSIVRMTANENPFGMSPKAKEAMAASLESANLYGNDGAILKKKIAEMYHFDTIGLTDKNILLTAGATEGLNLAMEIFVGKGDEVLYCYPTYQNYDAAIIRSGGSVRSIACKEDLHQDLNGLLKAIRPETKMVLVCNPNNPTGILESSEEVSQFIDAFPDDVILIVDEAYIQFADPTKYQSMVCKIANKPNVIVAQTFSKLYGMAGCRLGYLFMSDEVAAFFNNYGGSAVTRPTIAAGIAALDDKEFIEMTLREIKKGREYLEDEFTKMGYHPTHSESNFVYCDFGDPEYLAEEALKRGVQFRGNLERTRITVGTMEQNQKCVQVIKDILGK